MFMRVYVIITSPSVNNSSNILLMDIIFSYTRGRISNFKQFFAILLLSSSPHPAYTMRDYLLTTIVCTAIDQTQSFFYSLYSSSRQRYFRYQVNRVACISYILYLQLLLCTNNKHTLYTNIVHNIICTYLPTFLQYDNIKTEG